MQSTTTLRRRISMYGKKKEFLQERCRKPSALNDGKVMNYTESCLISVPAHVHNRAISLIAQR